MDVPLVAFVNTKAGVLQSQKLINKIKKCVPAENVFDLAQGGALPGLQKYTGQKYRIIVCGGDGSVGWVLTEIEKLKLPRDMIPPVAILPLGTGNDLARVLKWGGSHNGTKLSSFVSRVERACVVQLDKWRISYTGQATQNGADTAGDAENVRNPGMPHANHTMHNYFSLGADAHIALQFHEMRLASPEKFTSRVQNLAWYARIGLANRSPELIAPHVHIEINGVHVPLPSQTRCVVVLNLPSYSGGGNPWGTKKSTKNKFARPAVDDGLLEVVAVNGPLQLVGVHANIIRGKRLGQGNSVKITTAKQLSAQVDGEPWSQPPSVVNIQFSGKSKMLANSLPSASHSSSSGVPPLPNNPSSPSLIKKEESENFLSISRSLSARNLSRTRSASSPIAHTPSPIKYGPVQFEKRKKGRLYCDGCGLEFYLPYMLANHHNNALCSNSSGPSNLVKMPSTPPSVLSVQLGDGASSHDSEDEIWRSKSGEVRRTSGSADESVAAPNPDKGSEKNEEAHVPSHSEQEEENQKHDEEQKQEKEQIMQQIIGEPNSTSSQSEDVVLLPGSVPESDPSPSFSSPSEPSAPVLPVESLTETSHSETVEDKKGAEEKPQVGEVSEL